MKAVVFERFGEPTEVLEIREIPVPEPGPGQVRVRMRAVPVNPSDLMSIRGQYGKRPTLPATPGFEGVGVVEAAGPGLLARLRGLSPGRRVAVLNPAGGNWREQVVVSARQAVPLPAGLSDEQGATFFVNPATALIMIRHVLRVPHGAWLLQTAAGSALGRMIVHLGRRDGFHTINVVRRRESAEDILREGGDATICTTDEDLNARVQAITQGRGVSYALDAVGGAEGSAAAGALVQGGRMLVYGTLSGQPLTVHPRALMINQVTIAGFWLSVWVARKGTLTMLRLFREIGRLIQDGTLASPVGRSFPFIEVRAAVAAAELPGRAGKVLLRLADT